MSQNNSNDKQAMLGLIENINKVEGLVDIRDVVIDRDLPKEERIKSYLQQIKNPYCFKVGK